jgi:hypothetical protein
MRLSRNYYENVVLSKSHSFRRFGFLSGNPKLKTVLRNVDCAEKPSSDEKLGEALLAAPEGVRDASGSRERLSSRANPASPGFSARSNV